MGRGGVVVGGGGGGEYCVLQEGMYVCGRGYIFILHTHLWLSMAYMYVSLFFHITWQWSVFLNVEWANVWVIYNVYDSNDLMVDHSPAESDRINVFLDRANQTSITSHTVAGFRQPETIIYCLPYYYCIPSSRYIYPLARYAVLEMVFILILLLGRLSILIYLHGSQEFFVQYCYRYSKTCLSGHLY